MAQIVVSGKGLGGVAGGPDSPARGDTMKSSGWVKTHRRLVHSDVWQDSNLLKFWIWVLLKASHKRGDVVIRGQTIHLEAGQFICGRRQTTKETGLSVRTVRTCLATLARLENVTVEPAHRFSIVTVTNWAEYQGAPGTLVVSDLGASEAATDRPPDRPPESAESDLQIIGPDDGKKGEKRGSGEGTRPPESTPKRAQTDHVQEVKKYNLPTAGGGSGDGKKLTAKERRVRDAGALVVLYGEKVKPPCHDTSRPQAKKNAVRLMKDGRSFDDLKQAVLNYGAWCDAKGRGGDMRKNVGNFFGREAVYEGFMPGCYEPPTPQGGAPPDRVGAILAGVVRGSNGG